MTEHAKTYADSIVMVLHRGEFGWGGELLVNGEIACSATAGTAEGVSDSLWEGAFYNDVSGDASYTTGEKPADVP